MRATTVWRSADCLGVPDENGRFPNLKTLRDFAEITGTPAGQYRFEMQTGQTASDRSTAKIFPEEHHLEELERRLVFEEETFVANWRGTEDSPEPTFAKAAENGHASASPSDPANWLLGLAPYGSCNRAVGCPVLDAVLPSDPHLLRDRGHDSPRRSTAVLGPCCRPRAHANG